MKFKINFHLAKPINKVMINRLISEYPKQYSTPKFLLFIRDMVKKGWEVRLHTVKVSKYVFVYRDNLIFKIRFSNHKPIRSKQFQRDSDFYVGISHKGKALLTEDVAQIITQKWEDYSPMPTNSNPNRQWTQKECEKMDEREAEAEWHDDLPKD